ncbi:MAG: DUF262 domain-containing protein [Rhodobacteraceae bacterium]|nr:DUF262 domain-containing protein [Paracoccaceae bacterium]
MEPPKLTHKDYITLITEIETGKIKIPQFQRDFVWTLASSAALLDSVIKLYPIGTFILWTTQETLRSVRNIGNLDLPPAKEGETTNYVLDGQQRLTSLFAAFKGLKITRSSGKSEDFSKIYIDLEVNESDPSESKPIVITDVSDRKEGACIRLRDLLYGSLKMLVAFPAEHHGKLDKYKNRIAAYNFPFIEAPNVPIDIATEIFTRLNVGGKSLTPFEIMVAKTYDEKREFDLEEKYRHFIDRLEDVDYQTIPNQPILQLIALILSKDCTRQTILRLEKNAFIDTWPKAIESMESAIDYFRDSMRIPVSGLLPYYTLIVPFAYFFHRLKENNKESPNFEQGRLLEDFFWRCSLGMRYSSAVETKLAQDRHRMERILNNESPDYDWGIDISPEFLIDNGFFRPSRSFIKAILCILAAQRPLSFRTNAIVRIGNDWLKRANSKNYHHFFPRAFLKKKGVPEDKANNIVNITIVDDYLNKQEMRARPPSDYMAEFAKKNPKIAETMRRHLIDDLQDFGIWDDDYDTFMHKRAEALSRELRSRIIPRDSDRFAGPPSVDDSDDDED